MHADLPLVPLYRRKLTWVMRPNIDVVQWPNDVLELRWVRDQPGSAVNDDLDDFLFPPTSSSGRAPASS